ncbi:MAG: putative drug exporter of the superfamily [Solirubrobacteraceae bacterium]|jgi:RND superfamily putative drug exporter|nr:putative drug exporter of the superfamily [Solirubrobacteraceae bacterium]
MSSMATPQRRLGIVARVGVWAAGHRRLVALGWFVALVGAFGASSAIGTNYGNSFSLSGTDSQRAVDLLKRAFPAQSGDSDQIVFAVGSGSITSPAVHSRIAPALERIARLPHVSAVVSPYSPAGAQAVSGDGKIAFATVNFDQRANVLPKAAVERVISVAQGARSPQLEVQLGGQAIEQAERTSLGTATAVGLIAAMIVLLVTFGSLLAMGLPILTALLGLGTAIGLAGLASQVITTPDFATQLAAMIGLGVGIDYALFLITRFRQNYRAGMDLQSSITEAMDTAGRAVMFAGITVIIALLGQLVLGVSFLYGLAVASALAVLMTMLAALTILPAVLSRFGDRIARPGRRARASGESPEVRDARGVWARWSRVIQRHPWPGAVAGVAIMLTLAAPALALRLGNSDAGNNPSSSTTRHAYDLLARGFGAGFNGALQVVVSLPRAGDTAASSAIATSLRGLADVASVSPARLSPNGATAVFEVYPRSSPQSLATSELVTSLREQTLPPIAASTGSSILVGGQQATTIDFTSVLSGKLPLFIAVVVALSALLLLLVFRSLVIPLQAAVMNLLSIAASLGVVVALFQWGWLGSLLNVKGGPIEAFIPVMLFAIVFGLSMDYEVFLVSRIHEEWTRRGDASEAVTRGLTSTGRVITAAATIMICVFASFAVGDQRVLKLFGLSLASAVFLDAFVVRSLLLPSVLELLGRRTWALPTWLGRRLPHLAIDRADASAPSPAKPAEQPA